MWHILFDNFSYIYIYIFVHYGRASSHSLVILAENVCTTAVYLSRKVCVYIKNIRYHTHKFSRHMIGGLSMLAASSQLNYIYIHDGILCENSEANTIQDIRKYIRMETSYLCLCWMVGLHNTIKKMRTALNMESHFLYCIANVCVCVFYMRK